MTELYHYGVKGMKWGVRRAEKKRQKLEKYGTKESRQQTKNEYDRLNARYVNARGRYKESSTDRDWQRSQKAYNAVRDYEKSHKKELQQLNNYENRHEGAKEVAFYLSMLGGTLAVAVGATVAVDKGVDFVANLFKSK